MTQKIQSSVKVKQSRAEMKLRLREQTDEHLMCRDLRHSWSVLEDMHVVDHDEGSRATRVVRDLHCERCGTTRRDYFVLWSYGLEKTGTAYTYPDGYQMPGVPRGVKPSALVRGEQYRRVLQRETEKARGAA